MLRMMFFIVMMKKISKATKKRENPSQNTKITIEQKQKMIYNSFSKERENANNKTNK